MTVETWIDNREDDNFVIEDERGDRLYDARKTPYEPARYIMHSMIVEVYTWQGVTILLI